MLILNDIRGLWLRHKRLEKLRKEMKLTKSCCREMDLMLGSLGIDFSDFEFCPTPVEFDDNESKRE